MLRYLLLAICLISFFDVRGQQDMDLHLTSTFLSGKNIIKVKRNFYDPYLWVLAEHNEVYRINSITKTVDDFTSTFSAYNAYQFIDIAGRSADTVYIATNSPDIIEYKKGVFRKIGPADGVPGIVNSIGIDYTGSYLADNSVGMGGRWEANSLLIGTNNGMCHYDYKTGLMLPYSSHVPARVFETTYRSEMFSDLEFGTYDDDAIQYPAIELTDNTYGGFLWYGPHNNYGNNLYAAYYTDGVVKDDQLYTSLIGIFINQYWGTENGLFQNNRVYSRHSSMAQMHYLDGIKTNKITSILGLRAFGTSYDAGLIKENLLVGTDEGLYFSNSGYQKFTPGPLNKYSFFHYDALGNTVINDICVNATSYTKPVCEDGIWVAAVNGLYLLTPDFGPYVDPATTLNAAQFEGQSFQVHEMEICDNTTITAYIAPYTFSGEALQWYRNGQELPNESHNKLTITQSGEYYAVLYDPCSTVHFESNRLKVKVVSSPVFAFNYANHIDFCEGNTATLKTDDNPVYQYRWYTNGTLNGNQTAILNVTQNGKYKLEVSACNNNWVGTNEVEVNFITIAQPVITANKPVYCAGDNATLSINFNNDGNYTIQWYKDGVPISASTNKTAIIVSEAGNYTVGISSNLTTCSKTSGIFNLAFEQPPAITIRQISGSSLCSGQTVTLQASYSGSKITWASGQTTDKISVTQSGTYTATTTTAAGCTNTALFPVQFFPLPELSVPDAAFCQFTDKSVTLTAPAGFSTYNWNGQPGTGTFSTNKLGPVTLTVTDNNGCQATQTINISSNCTDIHIPNTFTPNGDGTNDAWTIAGLEGYLAISVRVYNRLGSTVFEQNSYVTPWNGTYKGKKLPAGVYYYVINIKDSKQLLSGYVSILY